MTGQHRAADAKALLKLTRENMFSHVTMTFQGALIRGGCCARIGLRITWRRFTMSMALGRSLTLVRMHRSMSSRTSSVHSSGTLHSCEPSQTACVLPPVPSEVSSRPEPIYTLFPPAPNPSMGVPLCVPVLCGVGVWASVRS